MIRMGVIETADIQTLFISPFVHFQEFKGVNQVTGALVF
jgi:hypothetical protein